MVNLYVLCVTRSKDELEYFHKVVHFLHFVELYNDTVQIVHLHFNHNDNVPNIRTHNTLMIANVYTITNSDKVKKSVIIYNLDNLIDLYKYIPGRNVYLYSGHSDGMYLIKKKIRLLRVEDFCELVYQVNQKQKADLIVFDCCLCGNINVMYICYPFTKYVLASTSYQSYLSLLHTHSIYKNEPSIENYCKNIIKEIGTIEKGIRDAYNTDFSVYIMNESVLECAKLVLMYKDQFNYSKSYVIDSAYYKDIECCFEELGIDISSVVNKFVIINRFHKKNCRNRKISIKKNESNPSKCMVVLKRPIKTDVHTKADIFLLN